MKYLKEYRGRIALSIILVILEVAFNIVNPKLMGDAIDIGIMNKDYQYVVRIGITMILLCLLGGASGLLSTVIVGKVAAQIGDKLRTHIFSKVLKADYDTSSKINKNSIINRISGDCNVLMNFLAEFNHVVIKPFVLFIFGLLMLFVVNYHFGIILVIVIPFQLALMIFMYKKTSKVFARILVKLDSLMKHLRQGVLGARTIKAFSNEKKESDQFARLNENIKAETYATRRIMAIVNTFVMILLNGVIVFILYIAGIQAGSHSLHIGAILAAITYSQQVLMSLMSMGLIFKHLSQVKVSYARVSQILNIDTKDFSTQSDFTEPISKIEFKNVCLKNEKGDKLLDDVSFVLNKGEKVAIIGETGSGKTLLLDVLLQLVEPTSGAVYINDENAEQYTGESVRKQMSVASQSSGIFEGTFEENICWGRESDYVAASKIADADSFISTNYADKYQTALHDKGSNLSGGEKQRVLLARAISNCSNILVMDDAIAEIDLISKKRIMDSIDRISDNWMCVLASQKIPFSYNCDKIIVIDKGRIVGVGTSEQLLADCPLYKSFYEKQQMEVV